MPMKKKASTPRKVEQKKPEQAWAGVPAAVAPKKMPEAAGDSITRLHKEYAGMTSPARSTEQVGAEIDRIHGLHKANEAFTAVSRAQKGYED
ncbi:MAG: hypothetical protein ABIW84_00090 [Ilumatobacteraceae bacterium]